MSMHIWVSSKDGIKLQAQMGKSDVCVWNYYSCFDKLHDICKLLKYIADLLEVSRFAIHLCCFGKGCINLTFQVPCFVKQRVFPLTSAQEKGISKAGSDAAHLWWQMNRHLRSCLYDSSCKAFFFSGYHTGWMWFQFPSKITVSTNPSSNVLMFLARIFALFSITISLNTWCCWTNWTNMVVQW